MEERTGRVVTVFRSRLREEHREAYVATAVDMAERARRVPGYVEHKAFTADDGERVTIVTFDSREAHDAWAADLAHRAAQRRGREAFYAEYSITVCDEVRHHAWSARGAG